VFDQTKREKKRKGKTTKMAPSLSPETIHILKSTAPVVKSEGIKITGTVKLLYYYSGVRSTLCPISDNINRMIKLFIYFSLVTVTSEM
jgi:hypothetical protein